MMTRRRWILTAVLARAGVAASPRIAVIAHPSNKYDEVSHAKLALVFLRRVSRWPWGAEAEPVDLPEKSAERAEFVRRVLKSSPERMSEYWIEARTTRGAEAPPVASSAAAVRRFVASRPGAIGYVPESAVDQSVKVLKVTR